MNDSNDEYYANPCMDLLLQREAGDIIHAAVVRLNRIAPASSVENKTRQEAGLILCDMHDLIYGKQPKQACRTVLVDVNSPLHV